MSQTDKKLSHPLFWRVFLILGFVCLAGLVLALYGRTIMEPYALIIICALLGAIITYLFERKKSDEGLTGWRIVKALFTYLFVSLFFAATFLSINILFPKKESRTEISAVVRKVYSETRHRSRRVGRRYVANGEEYKVYYMDVEFPGGYVKPRQIDFRCFRGTHPGDTLIINLETGFFGVPFVASGKDKDK